MAVDVQTLLDRTDDAISALLVALADVNVQEYQMPDGRRSRRAEFGTTLDALNRARATFQRQLAAQLTPRVSLGRLRRS